MRRIALLLLALLLGACGGSPSETPTGDASEAVAAPSGSEGEFCGELAQQLDLVRQAGDRLAQGDSAGLQAVLDELRANADELRTGAPPEVRADVETLVSALERPGDVRMNLASPQAQSAANNLREYARSECGLPVDGTEGGE